MEWATDPETVLATILQPTTMEDIEAEAAEGEAAAEGEEPAEGEGAAPADDAGGESGSE